MFFLKIILILTVLKPVKGMISHQLTQWNTKTAYVKVEDEGRWEPWEHLTLPQVVGIVNSDLIRTQ